MKKILILGATGKLGKVLVQASIEKGFSLNALVRNPDKLKTKSNRLVIIKGDVTNKNDLLKGLEGVDAVYSVLGHGFRTSYPIQEKTMSVLIPIMKEKNIKRLITITGAGFKTKEDPKSLILEFSDKLFKLIDPYRVNDARLQQDLLEKSDLNWTVVRTPVHTDKRNEKTRYVGYSQPKPWQKISRIAIANFMIDIIDDDKWNKKSPIIY